MFRNHVIIMATYTDWRAAEFPLLAASADSVVSFDATERREMPEKENSDERTEKP